MQQDCSVTPTADELRRAENGDPWAVLLVGILRTVPSNNGFHLTAAPVELPGLWDDSGAAAGEP